MSNEVSFSPASRKQEMFINSQAFLTIFGGAAGSGKTYLSLMRFLFYVEDPNFVGYVFRKNATDLKNGGGAFREAVKMFTAYDKRVKYTKQPMCIYFPSGATINFTGLDGESGMNAIQGVQISAAMLDEATHFTEEEVMWVISRLRTSADMSPCLWLTCNPSPDSFIRKWLEPFHLYPKCTFIDGELVEGRPKPESDGILRYYLRNGNEMVWGETPKELISKYGHLYPKDDGGKTLCRPRSFCFISATCLDNPPLLEANPEYVSNLMSLPRITRERLLKGNWFAIEEGSGYFKREWTPNARMHDLLEFDTVVKRVRAWDLASTLPSEQNTDPDYTVGVLVAKLKSGRYLIEDMVRGRWRVGELEQMLVEQAQRDLDMYGTNCLNYLPTEPASAGKIQKHHFATVFAEARTPIKFFKVSTIKSKLARFLPFASVSENGLVVVKEEEWNDTFFTELEAFTGSRSKNHDDVVDATADAFNLLATSKELPKISASALKMSV